MSHFFYSHHQPQIICHWCHCSLQQSPWLAHPSTEVYHYHPSVGDHDPEEGIKALSPGLLLHLMLAFIPQQAPLASSNACVSPPSTPLDTLSPSQDAGFSSLGVPPPLSSVVLFSEITEFPQAVLKGQVPEGMGIAAKSSDTSDR